MSAITGQKLDTILPNDNYSYICFGKPIYDACDYWLKLHASEKEARDADLDFNIAMLCHLLHPSRWKIKNLTTHEVEALTTFLGSVIEPCFRRKAPDLWNQIDQIAYRYAAYDREMGSDATPIKTPPLAAASTNTIATHAVTLPPSLPIILPSDISASAKSPMLPPAPPSTPLYHQNSQENENKDEIYNEKRFYIHPMVEIEDLSDELIGDDDDDDDDDDDGGDDDGGDTNNDLIEVPDESEREIEYLSTPAQKKPRTNIPPQAPRVLRRKILVWPDKTKSKNP